MIDWLIEWINKRWLYSWSDSVTLHAIYRYPMEMMEEQYARIMISGDKRC